MILIDGNRRDSEVEQLDEDWGDLTPDSDQGELIVLPTIRNDPTDEIDELEEMLEMGEGWSPEFQPFPDWKEYEARYF